MAINRYDTPAQSRFINTYSPVPFQELAAAAAARQGRLDEGQARLDAAQVAAEQIKYIPNSQDQRIVEGWKSGLSNLADEYLDKDLSDPEVYRDLRSNLRRLVNPNEVQAIQQSYAGYEQYKKAEAQATARGEKLYKPFDFSGYNTLAPEQGIFNQFPSLDLGQQAQQEIDAFLKKPQEEWRSVQDEFGRVGTEHYRDINKIYDLINSGSSELFESPAIRQFMEKQGLDEQGFKQYLHQLAPSYEVVDAGNFQFPPGYGKEPDGQGIPSTVPGPTVTKSGTGTKKGLRGRLQIKRNTPDINDVIPGLKIKKEGKLLSDENINNFFTGEGGREKKLEFNSDEEKNTFNAYADAASKYYGIEDFNSLSDKEKLTKINDYLKFKWTQQRNPEIYEYTEKELPEETKIFDSQIKLNPMFANRAVYDPTKPENQQLLTVRDLLEQYPLEKDFTWTPVGRTSDIPRQELALSKQVEIRNADGKLEGTYFIAGSDQERQKALFDNTLTTQLLYSDLPEGSFKFPDENYPDINYTVDWNIKEREGQLPVYEIMLTYPDGRGIGPISSKSIADLKNKLYENLAYFGQ